MAERCEGCGLYIKPGQARYTAQESRGVFWHFECHEARAKKLEDDLRRAGYGQMAEYLERVRRDPFHGIFNKPPRMRR